MITRYCRFQRILTGGPGGPGDPGRPFKGCKIKMKTIRAILVTLWKPDNNGPFNYRITKNRNRSTKNRNSNHTGSPSGPCREKQQYEYEVCYFFP